MRISVSIRRISQVRGGALACAMMVPLSAAFAEAGSSENASSNTVHALAAAGDAQAQYQLGRMYEFGDAVRPEPKKAVYWYRKAAEQDLPRAQYNLARMHAAGEGVGQDWRQAAYWLRKAADANYPLAMNRLGVMSERGLGMPKDELEAYNWYSRGAKVGLISAEVNRDRLRARLTREQLARAERIAREEPRTGLATSAQQ